MSSSFADALLKAGVIDQSKIDEDNRVEAETKKKEEDKKRKEQKERHDLQEKEYQEVVKKHKPFDGMKSDPTKKPFLLHLIHSFLHQDPENGVETIWEWESRQFKSHRCAFCNREVLSINDSLQVHKDAMNKHFNQQDTAKHFEKDGINKRLIELGLQEYSNEKIEQVLRQWIDVPMKAIGDRKVGVSSAKSSSIICHPCYKDFFDWIEHKIIMGDWDINSIIRKHMPNPFRRFNDDKR